MYLKKPINYYKHNVSRVIKKNIPFLVAISLVVGSLIYTLFETNIHGDSKFHAQFAKESTETGYIVKAQSHRIFNIENNKRIYMPIAYPLTSASFFTILSLVGGEVMLKIYSPLMAGFIFMFVYLIFKDFGTGKALLVSFTATLSISERLVMTPLIEPFVVVLLLASIYLLKKHFGEGGIYYLLPSGLLLGSAAAIKQQGLILAIVISAFVVLFYFLKLIAKPQKVFSRIIFLFVFLAIVIVVPYPAIKEQIDRTGTFAYSPGRTILPKSTPFYETLQPLLSSDYETDQEAEEAIAKTILYNKDKLSLFESIRTFILSPFLFYRAKDSNQLSLFHSHLYYLLTVSMVIGCILLVRFYKQKAFLFLLFLITLSEIATSYVLKTPINQYHTLGVLLITSTTFLLFLKISERSKPLMLLAVAFIIVLFTEGYLTYIYPLWSHSGRENNYHLEGYKRIGNFIKQNTPEDAIFLAPETSFRYYSERDTIWINERLGHVVSRIIHNTNDKEAAGDLVETLSVSYVVVNKAQTERYGVNDYLPPKGLYSVINSSPYFLKFYDPYEDGEIIVYKVNYYE